jgi:hypothetical protein
LLPVRRLLAAVLVVAVLGGACGDDGDPEADDVAVDDTVPAPDGAGDGDGTAGTEVLVFIDPTADLAAIDGIGDELVADERVTSVVLVDQQEAYDEFRCLFADNPTVVAAMTVQTIPASYRVQIADPDQVAEVVLDTQALPGVQEVVRAEEAVVPGTGPALELEVGSDCAAEGVPLK